jgi:SAM-dependent methyltransferase
MLSKIKPYLRTTILKSYVLSIITYIFLDILAGFRYRHGNYLTKSGAAHADRDLEESLAYIREVFGDYKQYSGLNTFYGSVAEVGPGDNSGVGLMFLADGCTNVDLVDRFYSKRDPAIHANIYQALFDQYEALKEVGEYHYGEDLNLDSLNIKYGPDASAEEYFDTQESYDFIVSRAVMEHVYDPGLSIARMANALKPDGYMLHIVDLRDHGMFSENFHELKFLEVPDCIYSRMTGWTGLPNRVLISEYRSVLETLPLTYTLLVTGLAGVGKFTPYLEYNEIPADSRKQSLGYMKSVKSKFAKNIKRLPDEDLCVTGIFLVARKRRDG